MTFNMENRLRAIAIPGSVGILLGYVVYLLKVVDSLVCHSVKVS